MADICSSLDRAKSPSESAELKKLSRAASRSSIPMPLADCATASDAAVPTVNTNASAANARAAPAIALYPIAPLCLTVQGEQVLCGEPAPPHLQELVTPLFAQRCPVLIQHTLQGSFKGIAKGGDRLVL